MSDDPKLCKDCRFAELDPSAEVKWRCTHRTSRFQSPRSLVTGALHEAVKLPCEQARWFNDSGRCGPDGRHWEPRD
jgi:hypothetical protein